MKTRKVILLLSAIVAAVVCADAQSITTTYSYAWKYDTVYKNQTGTQDYAYTGSYQTYAASAGTYKLEVWGAQGGYRSSSSYGGAGGYSVGSLTLTAPVTLYIYVGGSGNTGGTNGGFNGGGMRATYAGGGGGTDMRINGTTWYHRVIVAGGGGSCGASSYGGFNNYGYGGGTNGGSPYNGCGTEYGYGTQTGNSYSTNTSYTDKNTGSQAGGFGFGGYGAYYASGYGGAGGGGWYGGGGCYPDGSVDDDGGGGGGSGYVYTSSTASYYPAGCMLNSSYYLTNAQTIAGNTSFPSTITGTNETGHSGNGYARITYTYKVIDHIDSTVNHIYVTTTITDFVCKNGVYNQYGFTINGQTLTSGVHTFTNHFSYGNTDSTVCLNITIRPDPTTFEEIEAPYSYTWPVNGITYTESGIYSYSTVTQDGCDSTVILALTIYDPTIGIGENVDFQDVIVKPNPAQDYIDIITEVASAVDLTVYNIYGQACLTKQLTERETRVSLSALPVGTYFLRFGEAGKKFKTHKIIKTE